MLIDLHAHSNQSDGTDSSDAMVLKAKAQGITTLAITDHDTISGWTLASAAAEEVGLDLVRGIELSVKNEGRSQHLLAYEPDPNHPALVELLRRSRVAREARIPEMVRLMADSGVPLTLAAVRRFAGQGVPGRPHIADALVELGEVENRREAFRRYLIRGCDAYVPRWAPPVEDALATVVAAGGVPSAPRSRGRMRHRDRSRVGQGCARNRGPVRAAEGSGLTGIEVNHREHDHSARRQLTAIACALDLVITGSSDYHGKGQEQPRARLRVDGPGGVRATSRPLGGPAWDPATTVLKVVGDELGNQEEMTCDW